MRSQIFLLALFALSLSGCGGMNVAENRAPAPANSAANTAPAASVRAEPPAEADGLMAPNTLGSKAARELCFETNTGDTDIVREQTFAIEFEPFKGTCFITMHNPEYDDPPLESEFAIYRGNRRVAEFPEQFNGVNFGCWIEGVGFQDLNDDQKIDAVIVAKCSGKSGEYYENMVYANDGRGFTTNLDANYKLAEFKTVKQIAEYAREHRSAFFK
ncbi:MAG: hypothetical protein IPM21_09760 [Acidobacteria bacterium]|nr:hypothetical protein [Acidobacteriota bacterium]